MRTTLPVFTLSLFFWSFVDVYPCQFPVFCAKHCRMSVCSVFILKCHVWFIAMMTHCSLQMIKKKNCNYLWFNLINIESRRPPFLCYFLFNTSRINSTDNNIYLNHQRSETVTVVVINCLIIGICREVVWCRVHNFNKPRCPKLNQTNFLIVFWRL